MTIFLYSLRKDFIVQLINSQINLQCDKDPDSSIIMCIERAQLKTFSIVENWSKGDLINEVIKTSVTIRFNIFFKKIRFLL